MFIVEAPGLFIARLKAALAVDGLHAHFAEGHELPADIAKRIPKRSVGRLLSAAEANKLLKAMAA